MSQPQTPRTLYVIVDGQIRAVNISDEVHADGESFFTRMDQDMDRGWQMSREWVDNPDQADRCRIAAGRLVDAVMTGKETLAMLMAGYIKVRMPDVAAVDVDTSGEIAGTELIDNATWNAHSRRVTPDEAMRQAEKEISQVHRVGKSYRYSVYDRASGQWVEAATVAEQEHAEALRRQAVDQRMQELAQSMVWTGAGQTGN